MCLSKREKPGHEILDGLFYAQNTAMNFEIIFDTGWGVSFV
jgi:hypothetical protein